MRYELYTGYVGIRVITALIKSNLANDIADYFIPGTRDITHRATFDMECVEGNEFYMPDYMIEE